MTTRERAMRAIDKYSKKSCLPDYTPLEWIGAKFNGGYSVEEILLQIEGLDELPFPEIRKILHKIQEEEK